jgi:hypothetical protein
MVDLNGWHTIFLYDNEFYLSGRLNDEVEEIVSRDIQEIVSSISQLGLRELDRRSFV